MDAVYVSSRLLIFFKNICRVIDTVKKVRWILFSIYFSAVLREREKKKLADLVLCARAIDPPRNFRIAILPITVAYFRRLTTRMASRDSCK